MNFFCHFAVNPCSPYRLSGEGSPPLFKGSLLDRLSTRKSPFKRNQIADTGRHDWPARLESAPVSRLVLDHVVSMQLLGSVADSHPELGRSVPAVVRLAEDWLA